jgi:hypothetical protein
MSPTPGQYKDEETSLDQMKNGLLPTLEGNSLTLIFPKRVRSLRRL